MYIPVQDKQDEGKWNNFLSGFFKTEETFGDKVAKDIEALKKADKDYTMSKTTKALIGVGIAALVIGGGIFIYKKVKK